MAVMIPDDVYDPSAPLLADMASISVDVDVPAGATIDEITVMTKINHTWVGDITILLEAPNGDILPLVSEPGNPLDDGVGDSSDLTERGPLNFADSNVNDPEDMGSTIDGAQFVCEDDAICDYFANGDGTTLPGDATGALLATFADYFAQGDGLDGTWTLHVGDDNGLDQGTISGEMMAFELCISGTANDAGCVADFDCEETINVSLDVDAEATITVGDLLQDGFMFCDGDIVTISQSSFGCSDIGEVIVTVVVNDDFDPSNDDDDMADTDEQRCQVTVVVDGDNVPDANLACLGRINLTLNDECQGLLIPEMVLIGNRQCLDFAGLEVIVQDSDPSNGPIIDGCGEFTYTVRVIPENLPTVGFTGDFAPENWTEIIFAFPGGVQSAPSAEQIVTVDFDADEMVLSTEATVFNTGSEFGAQEGIMFSIRWRGYFRLRLQRC